MSVTDVVLIGGGPIGLEMAVALKDAGVEYVHVESRQIGHTISWFPRQCRFFSSPDRIAICGVPLVTADQSKASREDYLAYLRGIVEQFDLKILCYQQVTRLEPISPEAGSQGRGARFRVHTQSAAGPREYCARHVILAIGDMHRPRRLRDPQGGDVPGVFLPHVSRYFDDPHPYFRQTLLIVGGRNSAVEAAVRCYRAGARIALSYRGSQFDQQSIKYWLRPELEWLIETGAIGFYPATVPVRITPTSVWLSSTARAEPPSAPSPAIEVPADFVLLLIGYEMDQTLLGGAGVELAGENAAPVVDPQTMETSVPGLYVAGTAAAGTQIRFRLFIENCHSHVLRIARAITGNDPPHINRLAYQYVDQQPLLAES